MPRVASHPSFPSVTELLGSCGLVRDYRHLDDRYSQLGLALHETIAWHHEGKLDESSIHPEVRPGFDAYLEFIEMASHVPLHSELEMVDEGLGVVGHLDRIGSVGSVEMALIDWVYSNSPDLKGKRLQVAGYRLMWMRAHQDNPVKGCYVVQLGKNGVPRVHNVEDDYAMQVFAAAVIVARAKESK